MTGTGRNTQDDDQYFEPTALFSAIAASALAIAGFVIVSRIQAIQIRVQAVLTDATASPIPSPLASARAAAEQYATDLDDQANHAQILTGALIITLLIFALIPVFKKVGTSASVIIVVSLLVVVVLGLAYYEDLLAPALFGLAAIWTTVSLPVVLWRWLRPRIPPGRVAASSSSPSPVTTDVAADRPVEGSE